MNSIISCLAFIYGRVLKLYPPNYRRQFGDERQAVFAEELDSTASQGWPAVARLTWRECLDLPGSIFWAYVHEMEARMAHRGSILSGKRANWLGILPFIILGLALVLEEVKVSATSSLPLPALGMMLYLGGYLVIVGGLFAGMLAGFPGWSFPYLIYGIFFALYFSYVATPGLALLGVQIWGNGLWGWRAWIPVGAAALAGLLLSRPIWKPLLQMIQGIWQDWSRLVFGLYGLMPFVMLISQDEIEPGFSFPYVLAGVILVIAGASLFIALRQGWARLLGLAGSAFLAILTTGFGSQLYWKTHDVNLTTGTRIHLEGPVQLGQILMSAVPFALIVTLVLLAPALIGAARQVVEMVRFLATKARRAR